MSAIVKIYLESALIDKTEVSPKIKGIFEYTKETGKRFYKHNCKDEFVFSTKADYQLVKQHYATECNEVKIIIEKTCNGDILEYWVGFFKMFESKDNRDLCFIQVKAKPFDVYKCFDAALKTTVNLYAGTVVTTQSIGGEIEESICTNETYDGDCGDYYAAYYGQLTDCIDSVDNWCKKSNTVLVNGVLDEPECYLNPTGLTLTQTTVWHREVFNTLCVLGEPAEPTFGSGWTLLENNCGDNYAKWWRCPATSSNSGIVLGAYTRGRMFNDVLERIIENIDCELTIKSEFFGINAIDDAPDNIAYEFATNNCKNITLHQKSDIKLKSVLTPSTAPSWGVNLKEFFDDLEVIFNVKYLIVDGVFILEHDSYFTSVMGLDLTGKTKNKTLTYGSIDNVRNEKFFWPEESSIEFAANEIIYDCGEESKERRCTVLSTDIGFIENPANADRIPNAGFVLICNELNGTDLIIKNSNLPFNWVNLHDALHRHGRLFKSGKLNGFSQTFLSWEPFIKQDKFKFSLCCENEFDPNKFITTDLGVGSVASAEQNIFTGMVDIEMAY
jgi:hypothetical protein